MSTRIEISTPECADASYTVEYASGILIESGTIPSGGSKTVTVPDFPTCDDATWTLKDTDGNVLNTGTIASGGSADIVAPDGDITLNSIAMTSVESGGTENILILQSDDITQVGAKQGTHWRISDSTIQNSDASYSVDVKAEDDLTLPDSDINVNSVNEGSVVSVKDVNVNLSNSIETVTPDSVTVTGNDLNFGFADTTYQIFVDGVLEDTVSLPALSDSTLTLNF